MLKDTEKTIPQKIIDEMIDYLYSNGLIIKKKDSIGVTHIPISLYPSPIVKSFFDKIQFYQIAFNKIMDKISRDQEYIDSHPDEFGSVSSGEFIVAAMCPAMAAITQFACMFFSIALFRRVYYLPENYGNEKGQRDVRVITNANEPNAPVGYTKNLKMTKTDDRLYPNKKNLPNDLKYSSERVFEEINNGGK